MIIDLGSIPIVRLLVANGADINATNDEKETPLHKAAENGTRFDFHHFYQIVIS